ncbi:MAG: hypothetical protein R3E39_09440 [Anaerolineae bacterium]
MVALPVRIIIERKLNKLTEDQLNEVLVRIEEIESHDSEDYDETRDLTIGFIHGATDAGQRTKDILQAEFGVKKDS